MITEDRIKQLKSLLQSGADMDFFFSSIKSPEWLPALLEHGFFNSPPEPVRSGGWVQYPPWPQSRYLARIAAQLPETAVKAALHIQLHPLDALLSARGPARCADARRRAGGAH